MADAVYTVDDRASRIETALDGLTLVYHRPSGQTHILAEPAPDILRLLADGAKTESQLLRAMQAAFDIADDANGLNARLAELVETGLVARA